MASAIRNLYTQLYPPPPSFTEMHLPSLRGKVYIVTGGNAGVGFELVKFLHSKGAKIYMASRSRSKAEDAMNAIQLTRPETPGEIRFLQLDLGNLSTIKKAAGIFAAQETKLDVLWNNAGVANMPVGSMTKQGYELHMGTNCLGPFLFTQLLLPQLRTAAKLAQKDCVRIIWTSSIAVDASPKGGMDTTSLSSPPESANFNYTISKTGNWFLASQFAKRVEPDGIVSLTLNPGNLSTGIWDNAPKVVRFIFSKINHPPKFGAYTELWAGLSEEVTVQNGLRGEYVIPWGRWHSKPRQDIVDALKTEEEGGTGQAAEFWEWCEAQTREYA